MSLSSISIRRSVLAIVMSLTIVLFGLISYNFLGVREYPNVDSPVITVSTNYAGASADVIESQITEPLEESISGIAGIRSIKSVSREERSTVTVEFELEIELETAANDVRDRVSRALRRLPPDVDNPTVRKADADAVPIIFLNIKSQKRNLLELTDLAEKVFKERMRTIPGVSEVRIWGSKTYSMRLWMDPAKLASYGITPLDVSDALNRENVQLPSGRIEGQATELTIRTMAQLKTPEDFNNLIIKESNGNVVSFRDIGYAELGPENYRTILKRDGIPMVGLVLIPQPGVNYIAIIDEFYQRLEQLEKDLPADVGLGIGFDTTKYIRDSVKEVLQTILVAFVLVVLVIYLFLRDWRTTIIPVIAIPISLIGAFFIMFIAGFSINVLTLLGLVLAIGLVVDDAIVMVENIYKKIEAGSDPIVAGLKGSREVFFAIISTTVALAAVFMPVIFLQGLTGRLFHEFGIVVSGAVIISSFVALTLTPMLCTRILKLRKKKSRFYTKTEPLFKKLNIRYEQSLSTMLRKRWLAVPIVGLAVTLIFLFGSILPSELAPLEDRSSLRLMSSAQEGATFEYMDAFIDSLVVMIQNNVPESDAIISVTSPGFGATSSVNSGFINLILTDPEERERSQQEIADALSAPVASLTWGKTRVTQSQSIGRRRSGLPVQYVLQAPNFERLKEVLPKFLDLANGDPTFQFVDVNLKFNKPELRIEINRNRTRALGVSALNIARTLQLALSGQRFGYFIMNGKQYQVIGQLERKNRNKPLDLKSIFLRNDNGQMIQLDNLVSVVEQSSPPALYRYDRYVSATISAGLVQGKTIGDGIDVMDAIADQVLDESFQTALDGPSKDFVESSSSLAFAMVLALILIYLVLAAQFESFRDPLIIMFGVPLALAGALLSLWYFNQTLNIFSQIGQIMLIGLVTKNGILMVEFANQRKQQGLSVLEAIKDAAAQRFRPILMTSLSTILGILPIALALGAGSESRVSMGVAVIGGLLFATVLTLYVIPVIYSFLSGKDNTVIDVERLLEEEKRREGVIA